jgi:zinc protease
MKRLRRLLPLVVAIAACAGSTAPHATAQVSSWQQIKIPPLPAFQPQAPKRVAFPNGLVIFLQEDHELPLIDGVVRIRGGSRSEPANKIGLVDLYGEVWRTGGTKTQTGDQLDDFLEIRAAKVETDGLADSTTISWSCLKGDFADVFKVVASLLREPEFRADKLDLAQKEVFDSISRRNDEPGEIASRESTMLAYGSKNPYARIAEYATVAAVTREDLLAWHHRYVQPNNMIVGVVGDFDSTKMEATLREAFGAWPAGPAAEKLEIKFEPAKPGYYLVSKEDVNQSSIRMVELGTNRKNPDYYAIQVFNEAFGGGFSSRLFRNIRTLKGLAYGVGGGIGTAFDHPGIVRLSVGTKSASTVESIQAIYDEIDNLAKNPLSAAEIQQAKDSILNSFVFNFDSPDKVLRERMAYEFYDYPPTFLEQFRAGVEKVTPEDVARVAPKYLHKDQLAVLVVGNPAEFGKPLTSLGAVSNVDIAIPPPKSAEAEVPAKPAGSNPEGLAMAAKVVAAMGGEARLNSVKSIRVDSNMTDPGGGAPTPFQATIVFPDRLRANIQTPQGTLVLVVSPEAGFMAAEGMGARDLAAAQKNETMEQIKRDPVYLGQHLHDPAFIFAAAGSEKIGDIDTALVDVSGPGVTIRWYVDPQSGRILRETYQAMGQAGPFLGETDLESWEAHDGLTLPRIHRNKQNGKDSSVAENTAIQLNPAVDLKLFQKPTAAASK